MVMCIWVLLIKCKILYYVVKWYKKEDYLVCFVLIWWKKYKIEEDWKYYY